MIDPKKIEEWKLARPGKPRWSVVNAQPSWQDLAFYRVACEALPTLLAEREELLARIEELEDAAECAAARMAGEDW